MADYARYWGGVRGIFHTDELPDYDISEEEVLNLRSIMKATERDSVVIVADEAEKCRRALSAVLDRAKEALVRVPSETRAANKDGTTHYTRPRPGSARMYPETDVVSISIVQERLASLRRSLPEMPEDKLSRIMAEYGLNDKLARQVVYSDYNDTFERLVRETKISPVLIAVTLTETFKSLQRDGIKIGTLSEKGILETFKLLENELMVKESLPEVFAWMASHADESPWNALRALNLELMSQGELLLLVEKTLRDNRELVEQMGERAQGPLMGLVMSKVRGKARAGDVLALIKKVLMETATSSKG
jgi:glutamyl-tRNA(Gln) amidotransferase subunit E